MLTTRIDRPLGREQSRAVAPHPSGTLRIHAERRGERTVLTEQYWSVPFHLGTPSYRAGDGTAEVIVQQVGPGLFPDDDLLTEVTVGPGARLVMRGQSATKLYPCPPDRPARVTVRLHVAPGGWLAWAPGPLIPFRDGALRQEVTAKLATGARLILADVTTPGRVAMGERDAYQGLDLRCRVTVDNRIVFVDRSWLDPRSKPLASPARAADFDCVGALSLVGFGSLDLGGGDRRPDLWWQAGASGVVTVVRYLGTTAQAILAAQEAAMAAASSSAGGA